MQHCRRVGNADLEIGDQAFGPICPRHAALIALNPHLYRIVVNDKEKATIVGPAARSQDGAQ